MHLYNIINQQMQSCQHCQQMHPSAPDSHANTASAFPVRFSNTMIYNLLWSTSLDGHRKCATTDETDEFRTARLGSPRGEVRPDTPLRMIWCSFAKAKSYALTKACLTNGLYKRFAVRGGDNKSKLRRPGVIMFVGGVVAPVRTRLKCGCRNLNNIAENEGHTWVFRDSIARPWRI
ncbi:hypothetical protein CC86DRAFT_167801 [Ophiobolus disseminans]|uniref:Uncharacterized protein n=1 Tax=Ophiobolus disseminans TaxID=1469910 RepID=A0A6A7ABY7_9PLEO|nr:hypothetical protein CC86DRAFT_167801 [Ophiobolus disseminans]